MNELQPNEQPLGKLPPQTVFLQCGDISSKNVKITTCGPEGLGLCGLFSFPAVNLQFSRTLTRNPVYNKTLV